MFWKYMYIYGLLNFLILIYLYLISIQLTPVRVCHPGYTKRTNRWNPPATALGRHLPTRWHQLLPVFWKQSNLWPNPPGPVNGETTHKVNDFVVGWFAGQKRQQNRFIYNYIVVHLKCLGCWWICLWIWCLWQFSRSLGYNIKCMNESRHVHSTLKAYMIWRCPSDIPAQIDLVACQ